MNAGSFVDGATPVGKRLANTLARSATLTAKFFLLFALARFLAPEEVALYGLLAATISYALLVAGLDFYTFATRELLGASPVGVMKNQLAVAVVVHAALLPVLLLLFLADALPWAVVWWFFPLLWMEHLSQEINRLLVALSDQFWATGILFLRMAAWVVFVIIAMSASPDARRMGFLLGAWAVGLAAACLAGVIRIRRRLPEDWSAPVDVAWIRRGVRVALPMLLGTLAIRLVFTADRYWVEATLGPQVLAPYVLFVGLTTGLITILDAGVFSYAYPALVRLGHQGRLREFRSLLRKAGVEALAVSTAYSLLAWSTLDYLLDWIAVPAYQRVDALFSWLMIAVALQASSLPFHYALYAMNRDRALIGSQLAGALAFIVAAYGLTRAGLSIAVPAAVAVCFGVVLTWKGLSYAVLSRREISPRR